MQSIIEALVAGAAAAASGVANQTVKTAYDQLRSFLSGRFAGNERAVKAIEEVRAPNDAASGIVRDALTASEDRDLDALIQRTAAKLLKEAGAAATEISVPSVHTHAHVDQIAVGNHNELRYEKRVIAGGTSGKH